MQACRVVSVNDVPRLRGLPPRDLSFRFRCPHEVAFLLVLAERHLSFTLSTPHRASPRFELPRLTSITEPLASRGDAARFLRRLGRVGTRIMPRSIWKGVISFGMVAIPIRLYLATESKSISFRLLCPEHKTPIKNKRWCPAGDHEIAWNDVLRGYEYEKDRFVVLDEEDLAKLPL